MHFYKTLLIISALIYPLSGYSNGGPALRASTDLATEGFLTLTWNPVGESGTPVNLRVFGVHDQRPIRDLTLREQTRVHLSGFVDGQYRARIFDTQQRPLTNEVSFRVQHRDLNSAAALFGLGLGLFVLLISLVVRFTHRPG